MAVFLHQLLHLAFIHLYAHFLLYFLSEIITTNEASRIKPPSLDGLSHVSPTLVHLPQLLLETALTVLSTVSTIKGAA